MDQKHEKTEAGEIVVENRFLKWLDNFWYHHKWTVIVVGFFLIVGLVCFTQCATKTNADLKVAYAGDFVFSGTQKEQFENLLAELAPTDEEDVEQTVALSTYYIRDPEKMKADYTDSEGRLASSYWAAKDSIRQNWDTFETYIETGDCAVYFVSADTYRLYPTVTTLMRPLSDIYGESLPVSAYDQYAIRLGDTEFYQYYDVAKYLPEDTLILMPAQLQMGANSKDEVYARYEGLFRAIVEFKAPAES